MPQHEADGQAPRIAVCAIFKNEAPFLLEWLAYHHLIGVSHFFLYDNDSTDGGAALIQRSKLAPLVTLTPFPGRARQLLAYYDFIPRHATAWDWVAFIDLDEFILPLREQTLGAVLARRQGASAVLVNWRIFGPSGWRERPDGLVIQNYTMRAPDHFPANRHVKSIVRGADLLQVGQNPHICSVRGDVCNAAGQTVPNQAIQPVACHSEMVINHYQTRSRQDWAEKIARGNALTLSDEPLYPAELVDHYESVSVVRDVAIQTFLPRVNAILATGPYLPTV